MPLSVKDVMHRLMTINAEESVFVAVQMMSDKNVGSIIVEEDGKPVGIITERDIVGKISARGLDPKDVRCKEIMSPSLITVSSGAGLQQATQVMDDNNIKKLLVVDQAGKIVGIVSMTDLLRPITAMFDAMEILKRFV